MPPTDHLAPRGLTAEQQIVLAKPQTLVWAVIAADGFLMARVDRGQAEKDAAHCHGVVVPMKWGTA